MWDIQPESREGRSESRGEEPYEATTVSETVLMGRYSGFNREEDEGSATCSSLLFRSMKILLDLRVIERGGESELDEAVESGVVDFKRSFCCR